MQAHARLASPLARSPPAARSIGDDVLTAQLEALLRLKSLRISELEAQLGSARQSLASSVDRAAFDALAVENGLMRENIEALRSEASVREASWRDVVERARAAQALAEAQLADQVDASRALAESDLETSQAECAGLRRECDALRNTLATHVRESEERFAGLAHLADVCRNLVRYQA